MHWLTHCSHSSHLSSKSLYPSVSGGGVGMGAGALDGRKHPGNAANLVHWIPHWKHCKIVGFIAQQHFLLATLILNWPKKDLLIST